MFEGATQPSVLAHYTRFESEKPLLVILPTQPESTLRLISPPPPSPQPAYVEKEKSSAIQQRSSASPLFPVGGLRKHYCRTDPELSLRISAGSRCSCSHCFGSASYADR